MNILFLADIVPFPPNTGIKIRTFNILKQLAAQGNNVFLFCFNHRVFISDEITKNKYKVELESFCKEVHIFEIPSEKNIFSKYFLYLSSIFSREPYRVRRYYCSECRDSINELFGHIDIDLVHLDKTEFYKYAESFAGKAVFATNHNIESDLMRQRAHKEINLFRRLFAFLQWKKTENYERYALNLVNGYVTCSDEDANFFKDKLNIITPQVTVENGVDCQIYSPDSDVDEEDYFLIIGAQNKESTANFDATQYFFNDVWPILKEVNQSYRIKIVGRNPDNSIIEWGEKDERIDVIGFVEDEREVFLKAKALIVPLRIGGGSRLKILTAFGLGKAVISTSKGAEGIDCIDGSNILIGDTPEQLASHMVRLCDDFDFCKQLGESARKLAETRYEWTVLGKKLYEFYQRNK